jgi:hypothetical protein
MDGGLQEIKDKKQESRKHRPFSTSILVKPITVCTDFLINGERHAKKSSCNVETLTMERLSYPSAVLKEKINKSRLANQTKKNEQAVVCP